MAPTLYFTDQGSGEPLLFVHGWTCDSNDWLWQLAHFRATHRVIAPDLRGHGRSDVTPDGYDTRTFARDLIELLDRLDVRRCIAIGHSLGALIVSVLAVEYPERIDGIVCLDPAYGVTGPELDACLTLIAAMEMDTPAGPQALARVFAASESPSTPAWFRELHLRRMQAMDPHVVRETFRHLFTGDDPLGRRDQSSAYLARRTCPVLGIYALDHHERAIWERALSRHRLSRFLHFPLGHWLQQEAPDIVNQAIAQWLHTLRVEPWEDTRGVISESGSRGQ